MSDESMFRAMLVAATAAVFPIALYHRLRSQSTREPLDRRQEGSFLLLTLRPLGLATLAGALAYMIDPSWMAWSSLPLPAWLRWSGVALSAAAGALFLWVMRTLGPNLTDTVVTRRLHTLVTRGPYRWVRHPFYDAVALWVVAAALVAANWFLFAAGSLTFALLYIRTAREEERLVARFGDAYREYMARTGRFLPGRRRA